MARPQVSGAGAQRLKTLEEAGLLLQGLHSIVERMALAAKVQQPIQPYVGQFRRAAVPVADLLKGHFGPIADQVTALNLLATRSGRDRLRVNGLREGIAAIRNSLDVAGRKVYEQFAVEEEGAPSRRTRTRPDDLPDVVEGLPDVVDLERGGGR